MNNQYGITASGFKAKRLIDIKNELEDLFIAEFGDINLDPQSVAGQLIGIYSKTLADIWENLEDVYFSQYPNSATGKSLDDVVQLNGLTRLPASQTSVIGAATGTPNTFIPAGSLARIPETGEVFYSTQDAFITASNSVQNVIQVTAAFSQEYIVIVNGVPYIYSAPIINFSGPFVSGNTIDVKINGISIPTVTYAVSSANTMNLLASTILANSPAVAIADVVGTQIKLAPAVGYQIVVDSVVVTGAGAPTYTLTFANTGSTNLTAEHLAEIVDTAPNVTTTYVPGDNKFTMTADDPTFPYSVSLGTRLNMNSISSAVPFLAQNYGPVAAPAGSLTEILTPVAGWDSLTNLTAGVTGRFTETDVELRLRRAKSLRVTGAATVEAIRARLLQEVPGVTSALVFENVTLTQDPITITFSDDFITGNIIQVTLDGLIIGSVTYATSHLATMNSLAALIASQPQIFSATVGGTGDRTLTITMNETEEVEISLAIAGGASQPTYIESGGRPAKSFEAVVEGGADSDIGLKIWQTKPAGIQTYGNTDVIITDSQGNSQTIFFTRADPVYIWATVALTLNPQETFPTNGQELVAQAIEAYGDTLGIGLDVFIQRVQAQVFTVPGIASASVQLARTINPTDTPSYAPTDIIIGDTEVSAWDLSRIIVSI